MTLIFWTVKRIEELKRHWNAGLTGGQIVAAMSVTRNAIIGKAHRLGLAKRPIILTDEQLARREQKRQARSARSIANRRIKRNQFRGDKPMQELPAAPEPFAGSLNLPFGDLRRHSSSEPNQCRYIAGGGPDYLACGTETLPGESWCGHCKGIVYHSPVLITAAERERRSRQATRNWKSAEVKLSGTAEVAA